MWKTLKIISTCVERLSHLGVPRVKVHILYKNKHVFIEYMSYFSYAWCEDGKNRICYSSQPDTQRLINGIIGSNFKPFRYPICYEFSNENNANNEFTQLPFTLSYERSILKKIISGYRFQHEVLEILI